MSGNKKALESIRRLVRLTSAREALDRAAFSAKLGMLRADHAMDAVGQIVFEGKVKEATEKLHKFDLEYGPELESLKSRLGVVKPDPMELDFYD